MADFEEAKYKVMLGAERRSLIISDEDKRITAYHEIGHALVAKMIPGSDPIEKISIVARGPALGFTASLPKEQKFLQTKKYLEGQLCHILGGRCAELLVFNNPSTGAKNDLERATDIARKMVCEYGMSPKLGHLTFGKKQEEIFLGREIATHRDYSERTAELIDEEIMRIVTEAQERAERILRENRDKLEKLSEELLKYEVLSGDEFGKILDGKSIQRRTRKKPYHYKGYSRPQRAGKKESDRPPARVPRTAEKPHDTARKKEPEPPVTRKSEGSVQRKLGIPETKRIH